MGFSLKDRNKIKHCLIVIVLIKPIASLCNDNSFIGDKIAYFHFHTHVIPRSQLEITYSKSKTETLEPDVKYVQRCRCIVFIVNFEHISHLVLVFLLLILSR